MFAISDGSWETLWYAVASVKSNTGPVLIPVAVILWLVLRPKGGKKDEATSVSKDEPINIKGAPDHPHLQAFMFNDPPKPQNQSFLCPADNVTNAWPYDNPDCSGHFLPLHRPTSCEAVDKSGNYPYSWHFKKRKRLWEMRFQLRFKREIPNAKVQFGIELDEYVPMDVVTTRLMKITVATLRSVVGSQLYHSNGDDPTKVSGELERPVFAMPLCSFDQFIVTPVGQTPPALTSDISDKGSLRSGRTRAFIREISALELKPGPVFTFCFWGISRWLDDLNWQVKSVVPMMGNIDFNKFCGRPPVHLILYELEDSQEEVRHIDSRKNYLFRLAFWSSKSLPPQNILAKFVPASEAEDRSGKAKRDLSIFGNFFSCCTAR